MGIALRQLWTALATWFTVFNGLATAANNLTIWAEETTGEFTDAARIQRAARRKLLEAELAKDVPDMLAIANATKTVE